MRLNDSTEQMMLRQTMQDVLKGWPGGQESPNERRLSDQLIDMGLLDVVLEDRVDLQMLAVVFEELGRAAAASSFASALAAAVLTRMASGADEAARVLNRAAGRLTMARQSSAVNCSSPIRAGVDRIQIAWLRESTHSVVTTRAMPQLKLVELEGASADPQITLDAEPVWWAELTRAKTETLSNDGPFTVGDALRMVDLLRAAELAGLAEGALAMTVRYVSERQQFGQPLGAFQAVQHGLADVSTRVAGTRLAVYEALWLAENGRFDGRLADSAVFQACVCAEETTQAAAQFHGGIGHTLEYPLHHYYRRGKALAVSLGGRSGALQRVAASMERLPDPLSLRYRPVTSA